MLSTDFKIKFANLLLFFALLAAVLQAAGDGLFEKQEIAVPGEISNILNGDFNGDSLIDIAFVTTDSIGDRSINVYLQRSSERYPPQANQILPLSPSANMFQSFDIDGDGDDEILITDHDGVKYYQNEGDNFEETSRALVRQSTIFHGGIEGLTLSQPIVYSIDSQSTIFLPTDFGYDLYELTRGKTQQRSRIEFPVQVRSADRPVKLFGNAGGEFTTVMPAIYIADGSGDGHQDIYLCWPDRMMFFRQSQNGQFQSSNRLAFYAQDRNRDNLCQAKLVDFDRDGRLDLVCCKSTGGVSGAETIINFYGSDRFVNNNHSPSHNIRISDAVGNLMIDDLDGNGTMELVVPAMEIGTMSTVQMMITKKTDFHLLIYPVDNLGRPAQEPQVRRELSCHLDFSLSDPTAGIRYDWTADFNGDGWRDLVFADGGGQLMFFAGQPDDYLDKKSAFVIDMPSPDFLYPSKLNKDNKSDLVVIHTFNGQSTMVTLLMTRRVG